MMKNLLIIAIVANIIFAVPMLLIVGVFATGKINTHFQNQPAKIAAMNNARILYEASPYRNILAGMNDIPTSDIEESTWQKLSLQPETGLNKKLPRIAHRFLLPENVQSDTPVIRVYSSAGYAEVQADGTIHFIEWKDSRKKTLERREK